MTGLARTQDEISDQISAALEAQSGGSKWPGMSYEEGVDAALSWVTGERDEKPMEDA